MLAGRGGFVVRGKFVEQLDVGRERGARENAFEKIVAEQGVFGDFAGQRGFETHRHRKFLCR